MIESQDSTSRTNFMGCCKFVTSILVPQAAESLTKIPSPQASHKLASGHCHWVSCYVTDMHHYCPILDFHAHPANAWKIQFNMRSLAKENLGKLFQKMIVLPILARALEVPKMLASEVPSVLLKLMLKGRERSADAKRRAPESSASTLSL